MKNISVKCNHNLSLTWNSIDSDSMSIFSGWVLVYEYSSLPTWCVHEPFPLLQEETVPAMLTGMRDFACAQILPPDQWPWSGNKTAFAHAYKIRKWCPTQRIAAGQCCEQLVKVELELGIGDTFALRYGLFLCYNHGEYLSHSFGWRKKE